MRFGWVPLSTATALGLLIGRLNERMGRLVNELSLVTSGTYTPTLTEVANLDASTAYACQWLRVGNVVTVSGAVDVNPTTTTTLTRLGLSLPVASNFGSTVHCGGVAYAVGLVEGAAIFADITNDRAEIRWTAADVGVFQLCFTFTYRVI